MRGNKPLCITVVYRCQLSGNIDKRYWIENSPVNPDKLRESGLDPDSRQAWWQKGNWLNQRFEFNLLNWDNIAEGLLDILVLALMDTSVVCKNGRRVRRCRLLFSPAVGSTAKSLTCKRSPSVAQVSIAGTARSARLQAAGSRCTAGAAILACSIAALTKSARSTFYRCGSTKSKALSHRRSSTP